MRTLITFLAMALLCLGAKAQLTAAEAFTSAPASVFPLLDKNTRMDMVDYVNSGMSTPSANALQGTSVITAIAPEALTVKLSDSSTAQLIVLPTGGNDPVIALINTVASPGLDSTIGFYTSSWAPVAASRYFAKPGWEQWLMSSQDMELVTSQTPFMLASYAFDPVTSTLTLTNNLSRFLDPDIYTLISPSLRPTLTYTWTGKKFSLK